MKLSDFRVLTFDCYGTLIDWESGILKAALPLAAKASLAPSSEQILESFARHEAAQEAEAPRMLYSQILGKVYARMAGEWGVKITQEECARFGKSIRNWPAFPDSAEALDYLKQHFALVILSNVDRESFRASNARLGVTFDQIYTAQDIGSYKPDPKNFEYMIAALAELGYAKHTLLHVAESLFHDHAPANAFGLASAWIHRRHEKQGFGATAKPHAMPHYDFRFISMAELAQAHREECRTQSSAV